MPGTSPASAGWVPVGGAVRRLCSNSEKSRVGRWRDPDFGMHTFLIARAAPRPCGLHSTPGLKPTPCSEDGSSPLKGQTVFSVLSPARDAFTSRTTWSFPTWRAVPGIDPRRRDAGLHSRGHDMSARGCVGANALAAESKPSRSSWQRLVHPSLSTASNTRSLLNRVVVLVWWNRWGFGRQLLSSRKQWSWICATRLSLVRLAGVQVSGPRRG